jgi:P-type Mg2+ transporter
MFSMAGASVFLKFLPMLPTQILLNNLLYDTSQFAIPLDNVDAEEISRPRKLDIGFVKKFMLVFGPVSSLFDFGTFLILYFVFNLSGAGFQTGWFLESISTQALVIFIIRTRNKSLLKSRPSVYVTVSALLIVSAAWIIGLSRLGAWFKFTPLPWQACLAIAGITAAYLLLVELVKHWFYRNSLK